MEPAQHTETNDLSRLLLSVGMQHRIASQKPILKPLFESMAPARMERDRLKAAMSSRWGLPDHIFDAIHHDEFQEAQIALSVASAVAEDSAAAIVIVVYTSLERAGRQQTNILKLGDLVVPGVTFSQAIWSLSAAYRHFGEWVSAEEHKQGKRNREVIEQLGIDPLASNAAMQFLERHCEGRYDVFERKWISVALAIQDPLERDREA